jgi:Ca2+-binding RTX toxin-like protein
VTLAGDVIGKLAGEGKDKDLVYATVSHALGAEIDNLTLSGSAAIDRTGNALANTIIGNGAANLIVGGGIDTLSGRVSDDRLEGGEGNDRLVGGAGADVLLGGTGNDRFDFDALADSGPGALADLILHFVRGQDKIDLPNIDAVAGTTTNEAVRFVGEALFSGVAGELCFERVDGISDRTLVQADVDGDRVADLEILLDNGLIPLTAADFVL